MKIRAIITGATGMVGEGVLLNCLQDEDVESVLLINRRPYGIKHEKISEIVIKDFFQLGDVEHLMRGYNACFFCLGTTSVGINKVEYRRTTYDLTIHFASLMARLNPDMVFCYVSGSGTDSTGKGRLAWARVKGETENALLNMPFRKAYMFRPGFINPLKGMKNAHAFYKPLAPLYPFFNLLFPKYVCTMEQLGRAMIRVSLGNKAPSILECIDIKKIGA